MNITDLPAVAVKRLESLGQKKNWLVAESGLARAHVYAFCAGKSKMKWEHMERLFAVLGLTISIEVAVKPGKAHRRAIPTPPDMPI